MRVASDESEKLNEKKNEDQALPSEIVVNGVMVD
jgi:hypothetical protein